MIEPRVLQHANGWNPSCVFVDTTFDLADPCFGDRIGILRLGLVF